jgi:putative flippase GtrA
MRQAIARVLDGAPTMSPQLLRFATVGATTTVIDLVLFTLLVSAIGIPALANLISYSCGIAVSYALNSAWTFRSRRSPLQALQFVASMLAGLALSTALVFALSLVVWSPLAKVLSVPVVFIWNYCVSRFWVFRAPAAAAPSGPQPGS